MPAFLPPATAEPSAGTALAGTALYLFLFVLSLWGTWGLVRGGPCAGEAGPVDPGDADLPDAGPGAPSGGGAAAPA